MTRYKTLADVYAAILKGEIDPSGFYLQADSGDLKIYPYGEEGEVLLRTYEDDAFDFVAAILGMNREEP